MEVAEANPESWAVGFLDECWWSRVALPTFLSSWAEEGEPLRLIQRSVAKDDPEPKAISYSWPSQLSQLRRMPLPRTRVNSVGCPVSTHPARSEGRLMGA
jgi:hypothetical protein